MNRGNRHPQRKAGLSPYFALSIAGHLLLIAALGFVGLSAKPEIAERLPFRVGLALAQAPEPAAQPDPAPVIEQEPIQEPAPLSMQAPAPSPRVESAVEPIADSPADPVETITAPAEPFSFEVQAPAAVSVSFEQAADQPAASVEPLDVPIEQLSARPAAPDPSLTAAYLEHISELVDDQKRYPALATRRRLEGRVLVSARLDATGGVLEASILEDPDPLLSEAALRALNNAAPFGPLPEGRDTLQVSVPVRFRLKR